MSFINTILSIIIQGAIAIGPFAAFLLVKRKPRQPYLISIILCLSLIVSHSYYVRGVVGHLIESPFIIAEPFIFLISPLLYFYFSNIASKKQKLVWSDLKHLLPFVVFFVSFIPIALHGQSTLYYDFLYSNKIVMTSILWIILVFQFLYYYSKIYKINKAYTLRLAEQHSNYEQYDASWVRLFLLLFIAILAFVSVVLFVFLHNSNFSNFSTVVALFFSLQVYFVAYKGLTQKTFIIDNEVSNQLEKPAKESTEMALDKKQTDEKVMLEKFMLDKNPYLNPELTLTDLASQIGMSRNELSGLINNVIGSNFYLFVNGYRIDHVKHLMQKDKHMQFTLLALAYESGFNSKSTFNAIFKKFTGLTPSEYRKTLQ
ncbi:MAG: hypothetical protein CVU05_11140 [Bacteroidetes bacterium HGW-Bacteroidetes-21]|jgi:AraC-like DNA-binding protein|nr:MAG: hypothetical protein CVU05_11140 [Bacteroidetes bacterium HGW-Bacteroidetes-21]